VRLWFYDERKTAGVVVRKRGWDVTMVRGMVAGKVKKKNSWAFD